MKTRFFTAAIALCLLGITGCNKERMNDAGTQAGNPVIMTLQTGSPETRADYTEDAIDNTKMKFSWRANDAISVVVAGVSGNENCKLTATAAGKSAPFSGTVTGFNDTKNIYAIYPYNSTAYTITNSTDPTDATAALTLPDPQLYTIGGAISNSFMVGTGSATASGTDITASANLKQVMSIIKLNIINAPAKVTGVKLKCIDAIFATTATVKLSDATITSPDNYTNELSMTVTDNSTTGTKAISFAIFPKAKVDGIKIQIEVTYEGGKSKMIEKDDIAFVRNMHYVMEFDGTPDAPSITWAEGNLIADGANGAKIGTATDKGLFFQFGSLVGWWNTTGNPTIAVKPAAFNGDKGWAATGKIWQGTTGTVPFTVKDSGSDDEKAGIGDPCRYYLGGTWRLPTKDEYVALFKDGGYPKGTWKWANSTATNTTLGLTFPASGHRTQYGDYMFDATHGFYWSASPDPNPEIASPEKNKGYNMFFHVSGMSASISNGRATGFSVRCVQNASN